MKTVLSALCSALLLCVSAAGGELRTFRNQKGDEIKAEVISVGKEKAELKREDGKTFHVQISTLSDEDQKWLENWRATHRQVKLTFSSEIRRAVTREEKNAAFGGGSLKGNDCTYQILLKNAGTDPSAAIRVETILFAPAGSPAASACAASEVPAIAPGKSATAKSAALFIPQRETVVQSGLSSVKRYSEGSPLGLYAEFFMDGKSIGHMNMGTVPEDAAAQLAKWRESQAGSQPAEKETK